MNSFILEYLASYGIDPAYIIIGLFAVTVFMIILHIVVLFKMRKLYKKYDRFMRGSDMESMEEVVWKQLERLDELEESDKEKKMEMRNIERILHSTYQKTGLVKYDAFREMSGKLSYALVLLDQNDNGVIINSMYSREGCYSYVKEVIHGETDINLSEEEEKALKIAVNKDKISE